MRKYLSYIIASLFMFISITGFTQETITNLEFNPRIQTLHLNQKTEKRLKEKAVLELPFIDDFAKSVGYPDSSLWADKYAFTNLTYAYEPLSIGVATLDAIDGEGAIYANASSISFSADTLTSKPINLTYPGDNTIFLSFFYQPGGLGDSPELNDSLILEFFSPDSSAWYKIWHVTFNKKDTLLYEYFDQTSISKIKKGNPLYLLDKSFHNVILPVNEDQYLKGNFQFRFRNRASLSTSQSAESKASNSDHWHLDYLILNKDRNINDTIVFDACIKYPIGSLLKTYESMPWKHFQFAVSAEQTDSLYLYYANNGDTAIKLNKNFNRTDLLGTTGIYDYGVSSGSDAPPFSVTKYKRQNDEPLPFNKLSDSALFEIKGYIGYTGSPATKPYRWNDTSRFYQKFYNYYAFDDGTAENGYGIIGEGSERAMVAMRFQTFKKDTLRGVQMYFNQTRNNANQYTFKIHVWNVVDGKPGTILYTLEGQRPQNEDELNKFTTFVFDQILVLEGAFFIGWQKVNTSEMLNVGFDVNRINNTKLYYNFSGSWVQSQIPGTVMIRPIFGHDIATSVTNKPETETLDYIIYPNPAHDELNINIPETWNTKYRFTIFDTYGRVFFDKENIQSNINISHLSSGIYFIRVSTETGKNTTKKFIVIH